VLEALDQERWHYGKTAKRLNITEHQLYRLRQKFGLT
jgi:DNA-binding NtrC family response regulator